MPYVSGRTKDFRSDLSNFGKKSRQHSMCHWDQASRVDLEQFFVLGGRALIAIPLSRQVLGQPDRLIPSIECQLAPDRRALPGFEHSDETKRSKAPETR